MLGNGLLDPEIQKLLQAGGAGAELVHAGMTGGPLGGGSPVTPQIAHSSLFNAMRYAGSPGELAGNVGAWFTDGLNRPGNIFGDSERMRGAMTGLGLLGAGMQQPQEGPPQHLPRSPFTPPPVAPIGPTGYASLEEQKKRRLLAQQGLLGPGLRY